MVTNSEVQFQSKVKPMLLLLPELKYSFTSSYTFKVLILYIPDVKIPSAKNLTKTPENTTKFNPNTGAGQNL